MEGKSSHEWKAKIIDLMEFIVYLTKNTKM